MWVVLLSCAGEPAPSAPTAAPPASPGPPAPPHLPGDFKVIRPNGPLPPVAPPPPGPWPSGRGDCPADMAKVPGRAGPFCMHRYEAVFRGTQGNIDQGAGFPDGSTRGTVLSAPGAVPTTAISWYQSMAACREAGLHLCTSAEWVDACIGPEGRAYPTPDGAYRSGLCGIRQGTGAGAPKGGGSWPDCHTPDGIYDLLGNAWEWADPGLRDDAGLPIADKHGAAFYTYDAAPCSFSGMGSDQPFMMGTIGFRCCTELSR